jgi:hypothetical protein
MIKRRRRRGTMSVLYVNRYTSNERDSMMRMPKTCFSKFASTTIIYMREKSKGEWCACKVIDSERVKERNRIPAGQQVEKRRKVIKKANQSRGVYNDERWSMAIHAMRNDRQAKVSYKKSEFETRKRVWTRKHGRLRSKFRKTGCFSSANLAAALRRRVRVSDDNGDSALRSRAVVMNWLDRLVRCNRMM